MTADEVIAAYGLVPHPEGGHFRETHRSAASVPAPRGAGPRSAVTDIYYLLRAGEVSRFHAVAHDEIWHFYAGAPLRLLVFDGHQVAEHRIGAAPPAPFQHVVPGGIFQAAESTGAFTLVGCTVAPGFDFRDFTFLRDRPESARRLPAGFARWL